MTQQHAQWSELTTYLNTQATQLEQQQKHLANTAFTYAVKNLTEENYTESIFLFNLALQNHNPEVSSIKTGMGHSYRLLGNQVEALKCYEEALKAPNIKVIERKFILNSIESTTKSLKSNKDLNTSTNHRKRSAEDEEDSTEVNEHKKSRTEGGSEAAASRPAVKQEPVNPEDMVPGSILLDGVTGSSTNPFEVEDEVPMAAEGTV